MHAKKEAAQLESARAPCMSAYCVQPMSPPPPGAVVMSNSTQASLARLAAMTDYIIINATDVYVTYAPLNAGIAHS